MANTLNKYMLHRCRNSPNIVFIDCKLSFDDISQDGKHCNSGGLVKIAAAIKRFARLGRVPRHIFDLEDCNNDKNEGQDDLAKKRIDSRSSDHSLSVCSWNINGHDKIQFIKQCMLKYEIVILQETWHTIDRVIDIDDFKGFHYIT